MTYPTKTALGLVFEPVSDAMPFADGSLYHNANEDTLLVLAPDGNTILEVSYCHETGNELRRVEWRR